MHAIAVSVSTVLIVLAAVHVYWACGGLWPGRDAAELAQLVIGGPAGLRMASPAACVAVALALISAAVLVLAAQGLLVLPVSSALIRGATFALAAVLTLRGALGFLEMRQRPAIVGTRYARLNAAAYSPLALGLGLGTFTLAL